MCRDKLIYVETRQTKDGRIRARGRGRGAKTVTSELEGATVLPPQILKVKVGGSKLFFFVVS
uniref:Expressed protein n=1 Tax=Echinococcus granulosus TaxID=6210 RepID=A0A068W9T4_ECHGR|nr:expressed protein [Echinococcus granulosus]